MLLWRSKEETMVSTNRPKASAQRANAAIFIAQLLCEVPWHLLINSFFFHHSSVSSVFSVFYYFNRTGRNFTVTSVFLKHVKVESDRLFVDANIKFAGNRPRWSCGHGKMTNLHHFLAFSTLLNNYCIILQPFSEAPAPKGCLQKQGIFSHP